MKALFYILVAIGVMLMATSCPHLDGGGGGGGGVDMWYYIYINGDTDRIVRISYLEREKVKNTSRDRPADGSPAPEYIYGDDNIIVTENVALPFFKEVHTVHDTDGIPDEFLEITSENDSTTKAVIFEDEVFILRSDSSKCWSIVGNLVKDKGYSTEDCESCTSCKGLTPDSIMSYLKNTRYPCYLEFSQGDTRKRVRMYDYWGYD
ncbi:MAG: hypothetical protein LBO71_10940 [Prevotellaceae bacterium]|jgi:hypothetical protein|nr:hypothetical protein [Prevotellaceae bacterium]